MELKLNNFPPYAIHLCSTGFTLIKKSRSSDNHICETYKSASLSALDKECGIFFGEATDNEEIHILSNATPPVLVPKEIFQKPASQYLALQHDLADNETIFEDTIADYIAIYPFSISKLTQIQRIIQHPIFHHTAAFLYKELTAFKTQCQHKLLLLLDNDTADFVFLHENQLRLINRFKFTTKDDLLYYVLNILLQHRITTDNCAVLFAGEIENEEKTLGFLKKYLPQAQDAVSAFSSQITNHGSL